MQISGSKIFMHYKLRCMATEDIEADWWKWGEKHKRKSLPDYPDFLNHLEQRWNKRLTIHTLLPGRLKLLKNDNNARRIRQVFADQLPGLQVSLKLSTRLKRSVGKSYPDLVTAAGAGEITVVDAVLFPVTHEEVVEILKICSSHKILVIPFGGGTNVVGALKVNRMHEQLTVSIDLIEMKNLLSFDEINHTVVFQAGVFGPELENQLNQKGFTLGHFPQSFEYSSLGGWIATRSGGQESSAYGKIEDMVISLKVAVTSGTIVTGNYENDAEGINIKSLFFGSEGTLGIITEAKLLIHRIPECRKWISALFRDFQTGVTAVKELVQCGIVPSVIRYADEQETFFLSLMSNTRKQGYHHLKTQMIKKILKFRSFTHPCLLLLRFDGTKAEAERKYNAATRLLKKHQAFMTGERPGLKWQGTRFGLPYLVDDLIERDIFVDTVETVLPWDKLNEVRSLVSRTLNSAEAFQKEKGILLAHVSHVYQSAASIYFTIITPKLTNPYQQWKTIKTDIVDIIVSAGGAVSHHHSVGTDLKKWYLDKTDHITRQLLNAIKGQLDPAHIMNPGKLTDE